MRGLCCHASCIIHPSHDTTLHLFQSIPAAITVCVISVGMPPISPFNRTALHCISSSPSMLRSLSAWSLLSCLLYHPSIARHFTASLPVHPCCDHSLRGLCCHASCIILPSHDTALHLFQFIHAAIILCAVSVVVPPVSPFHRTTLHCISSSPSMLRSLSSWSLLSCLLYHPSIARHFTASLPVHPCCDHSLRGLCCHASCIILPSHDTALHVFQFIHAAITLCAVSVVVPPVSPFHRTTLHSISSSPSMLRSLSARSLLSCLLYHPFIARHCTASLPVHPCCDHSLRGLCCLASCIILPSHDDTALHLLQSIHDAITVCAISVVMPPVSSFHRTTLHYISSSSSMLRSLFVRSLLSCLLYHPSITRHCTASLPVHPCCDHSLRGLCCHASCIILPSHEHCTASLPVHPCCNHSQRGLCCHASCIILPSHDTALHLFQSIHDAITLCAVSVVMPPVSSFHRTTTLHCISSSSSMLRSLSARSLLSCLLYHPSIPRHCTASLPVHPCCDHSLRGLCCHAFCIILPSHDTASLPFHPCCDHSLRGLCCHASCIILPSHDTALHLFQFIHAAITLCAVSVVMPPVSPFHRTTLHCISSSPSMLRSLSSWSLLSCLLYHPSIARHFTASLPVHPCCDHSLRGLCCHASCIILPSHDTALHVFQFIHAAITLCAVSVVVPPVSPFHRTTLHSISSSPSMLRSLSARSLLSCLLYHPFIARHCTASLPVHPCCDHSLRGLCCLASCIILPPHDDNALHLLQSIHDAITVCAISVVMPPVSSFHRTTLHYISSSSSMLRSLSARSLLSCLLYHPSIARHCTASLPVHPCCDHSLRGLCCRASCITLPSHDTAQHLFQSIHAAITLCAVSVVMPSVSSFHRTTLHCISSSSSMLRSLSARSLLSCLLYHPSTARRQCTASPPVHP